MHVSFEITTTKLTNKKEQLVNIVVHIKDQKKVFSHLFKVFLNRRLAIMSINAIGSLKDREEDVELKEVEASEQQPSSPESDSDSSSGSDDWPSPRPSTSASVLPEAGSPALNSSIDLDNTASTKKVKMTGKGRKRFADELRGENKRLRAENDELRAEVVPDRFPRLANELEMREEEREKQRNRQKMKWLVDHVEELTTKVKKLTTMVNDLTKMREVDNYNREKRFLVCANFLMKTRTTTTTTTTVQTMKRALQKKAASLRMKKMMKKTTTTRKEKIRMSNRKNRNV